MRTAERSNDGPSCISTALRCEDTDTAARTAGNGSVRQSRRAAVCGRAVTSNNEGKRAVHRGALVSVSQHNYKMSKQRQRQPHKQQSNNQNQQQRPQQEPQCVREAKVLTVSRNMERPRSRSAARRYCASTPRCTLGRDTFCAGTRMSVRRHGLPSGLSTALPTRQSAHSRRAAPNRRSLT